MFKIATFSVHVVTLTWGQGHLTSDTLQRRYSLLPYGQSFITLLLIAGLDAKPFYSLAQSGKQTEFSPAQTSATLAQMAGAKPI